MIFSGTWAEPTSQHNQAHVYFGKYNVINVLHFFPSHIAGQANQFLDLLVEPDTS